MFTEGLPLAVNDFAVADNRQFIVTSELAMTMLIPPEVAIVKVLPDPIVIWPFMLLLKIKPSKVTFPARVRSAALAALIVLSNWPTLPDAGAVPLQSAA